MKAVVEWLVVCERLIHDTLSDNISLVSCLHTVEADAFPSELPGFAFAARLSTETPPAEVAPFACRLVRLSQEEVAETVFELPFDWAANARTAQIGSNFRVLRLKRAELLGFRLDYRAAKGRWIQGPTVHVEVRLRPAASED